MKKPSIFSLTRDELQFFFQSHGNSIHLASILYTHLYKKSFKQEISKRTMDLLVDKYDFDLPVIAKVSTASDRTIKFLMQFKDENKVETVLIPFHKRYTVCLSSQVGCAMKCSFCFTGTQGLKRHLNSSEIIGQYIVAKNYLEEVVNKEAIKPSIVFMGQGEPLHNFDEVNRAINIMMDPDGLALGPRQMTLSTAGFLPGLKRFNELPKINLALSLHSAFNETRKELIPITGQYPLEEIFTALDQVKLLRNQFITYEYLLIDELNDTESDADALKELLGKRKAIINIIPFNPFPGSQYKRPSSEKVEAFKEMLVERSLRTMVRTTKGSDILAACGQLTS